MFDFHKCVFIFICSSKHFQWMVVWLLPLPLPSLLLLCIQFVHMRGCIWKANCMRSMDEWVSILHILLLLLLSFHFSSINRTGKELARFSWWKFGVLTLNQLHPVKIIGKLPNSIIFDRKIHWIIIAKFAKSNLGACFVLHKDERKTYLAPKSARLITLYERSPKREKQSTRRKKKTMRM